MNYLDSINLFGIDTKEIPCVKGTGAPTTATEGAVGCFYMDTDTGDVYKCTAVADGVYTWLRNDGTPDAITHAPQNLTPEQKVQARDNIDAADRETVAECADKMIKMTVEFPPKNLLDTSAFEVGNLDTANGEVLNHVNFRITEYIEIDKSAIFSSAININNLGTIRYCLFDSDKKFLSGGNLYLSTYSGTYRFGAVLQENGSAKYVRISLSNVIWEREDAYMQIENALIPTIYEPYFAPYLEVNKNVLPREVFNIAEDKITLKPETIPDSALNGVGTKVLKTKYDYVHRISLGGYSPMSVVPDVNSGKIVHCGKNLFDASKLLNNSNISFDNGVYSGMGSAFSTALTNIVLPKFKPHTTYVISYDAYASAENMYWRVGFMYDDGSTRLAPGSPYTSTTEKHFTVCSTPAEWVEYGYSKTVIGIFFEYSNSGRLYLSNFQLEEAKHETEYEEYHGEVLEFDSETAEPVVFQSFVGDNYIFSDSSATTVTYYEPAKSIKAGKTLVCLGDSITGNYDAPTDYPSLIEAITGMNIVNGGVGSTRMSLHTDEYRKHLSFCSLADAIASGDFTNQITAANNISIKNVYGHMVNLDMVDWNDVDYLTVFFGTNDWTGEVSLDNAENAYDTSTYLGAFRYGYEKIMSVYPHIKVVVVTPMYRHFDSADSDTQTYAGKYLYEFGDALIDECKKYKIPFIDMYRISGVNKFTKLHYIEDGTHPTENGRRNIANIIAGKLISEN